MKIRTVIKHEGDQDVLVEMKDLVENDKFTLKEPDGTLVGTYIADSKSFKNDAGIQTIMIRDKI